LTKPEQSKIQIIEEMLRRYGEAQETMNKGGVGDGDAVTLMSLTWNESYRELERVLKAMRPVRPSQWWHLTERFLRCQDRVAEVRVVRSKRGPELKLPPHSELGAGAPEIAGATARVRLVVWDPSVRMEKVRRGLEYVSSEFRGEPFLPAEFLPEKAAA
jgi:hypothetical protein